MTSLIQQLAFSEFANDHGLSRANEFIEFESPRLPDAELIPALLQSYFVPFNVPVGISNKVFFNATFKHWSRFVEDPKPPPMIFKNLAGGIPFCATGQPQDQAQTPVTTTWPPNGGFPFGMPYNGLGPYIQNSYPTQFNPYPYPFPGPLPSFSGPYHLGIPSNTPFTGFQAPHHYLPPNYPPPPPYPLPNYLPLHPPGTSPAAHRLSTPPPVTAVVPKEESFVRREAIFGQEEERWNHTKWVWRSSGISSYNGRRAETRSCLGALVCPGCGSARCRFGEPLQHQTCKARSYHFKMLRNDVLIAVWEHVGDHDTHKRPPGGMLSKDEQDMLDNQVSRRQNATAHQLRTGDAGPGSVPLADIAPVLANPRAARYHVSQSQARVGIPSAASSKGGLGFLQSFTNLRNRLTTPFIVDSSLNGPVYVSFQTPFMDDLIKESVEAWISDFSEGPEAGRHGFVTDGDMSFFRHGPPLASCVFSGGFTSWAPVLYTWIGEQDTAHHRAHFRCLFKSVIKHAGARFNSSYLSITIPSFSILNKPAQDLQRKILVEEAQTTPMRVKKNGQLVPRELVDIFDDSLRRLLSQNTTPVQFDETVTRLKTTFPRIVGWVNWWLRPPIASMIFPARSVVNPDLAAQVPSTSNAIEHQHSLLHHATGTDWDLVPGAENIWLHVRELEKQYEAIQAGHFAALPLRGHRPPRPPHWGENDGRAPDTAAALGALQDDSSPTVPIPPLGFTARSADPSSMLDAEAVIPKQSLLAYIFYHYERRWRWVYSLSNTDTSMAAGRVVRQAIFKKWRIYAKENDYGCAKTWMRHAITDEGASEAVQLYFGLQHSIQATCPAGHTTVEIMSRPQTFVPINVFDLLELRDKKGPLRSWSDYFASATPRVSGGNESGGTTPVHEKILPLSCSHLDCACLVTQ
ncbi:hypothetical protein DFH07DRAFT_946809, partial [Mycena maculata]